MNSDEPPTRPRTDAQRRGDAAEDEVARLLETAGWMILGRNVRMGRYELDLVAVDPGPPPMLVIVEVRWRGSRAFGLPEETVDHRKRTRIRTGAYGLLDRGTLAGGAPIPRLPLRFDVVVLEPDGRTRHYRAAF